MSSPQKILQHYLTMIMRQVGLPVDLDTYAEILEIVDGIIFEAQRPLQGHRARIEALEKDKRPLIPPWIGSRRIIFSSDGDHLLVTDPPHMDKHDNLIEAVDLDINYFCAKYGVALKQIVTVERSERYKPPLHIGIFEGTGLWKESEAD